MLVLPETLSAAIRAELAMVPSARWLAAAQALSERYRAARSDPAPIASGDEQVLGYAALIMPATYAQLHGAMAATAARIPGWQPQTMLDLGSGPGTALWAACAHWPSLTQLTAREREPAFIALGKKLAARGEHTLQHTIWQQRDLRTAQVEGQYDLVVLGHVLNELDDENQVALVQAAWAATTGVLLIVEPGTSAAFPIVRRARDQLRGLEAQTIAPCAHNQPCPLVDDWCHFPQRLKRPDFQRRARGAPSEWEDAKFSYAAMARFPPASPIWGRVIREVVWNKAYAEAQVSTVEGIVDARALKRHKDDFRRVKNLAWGEAIKQPLPE